MKALVLSGGEGTRLRPFTYSMPKQLMPVGNKPVLQYVLEDIVALGVVEIGVIVGTWGSVISDVIGDGSQFGARITYLRQTRPLGLAHCVSVAHSFLGDDDFVMYLGDNFLPDGMGDIADEFRADCADAHVVVRKVPDPRSFGVVELSEHGHVLRLVEKPRQPRSDLALIGVYFFTAAIHEAVDAIEPSARGELEITDAIQWLVANRRTVKASEYGGFWKDAGRVEDVLECNRHTLSGMTACVAGLVDEASELSGRVVVERGARVIRSRIDGPVIIGAHTVIEDSQVGPNTSIGRDCVLRATRLADSILLDGASIADVSTLYGSMVGRGATVSSTAIGTRHRIVVGDHARIDIAA